MAVTAMLLMTPMAGAAMLLRPVKAYVLTPVVGKRMASMAESRPKQHSHQPTLRRMPPPSKQSS
eukprot:3154118-Lingulodinium_polyedra.AAC.1